MSRSRRDRFLDRARSHDGNVIQNPAQPGSRTQIFILP